MFKYIKTKIFIINDLNILTFKYWYFFILVLKKNLESINF